MCRRLLNLLTVLSLLLCVVARAMWVRSYWRNDSIGWGRNNLSDDYPASGEGFLVDNLTADFEWGRVLLRWWHYGSPEWTGSVPRRGFWAESGPSVGYANDLSGESNLGCWLHHRHVSHRGPTAAPTPPNESLTKPTGSVHLPRGRRGALRESHARERLAGGSTRHARYGLAGLDAVFCEVVRLTPAMIGFVLPGFVCQST